MVTPTLSLFAPLSHPFPASSRVTQFKPSAHRDIDDSRALGQLSDTGWEFLTQVGQAVGEKKNKTQTHALVSARVRVAARMHVRHLADAIVACLCTTCPAVCPGPCTDTDTMLRQIFPVNPVSTLLKIPAFLWRWLSFVVVCHY